MWCECFFLLINRVMRLQGSSRHELVLLPARRWPKAGDYKVTQGTDFDILIKNYL